MELGIKAWKSSRWSNCIVMQQLKCGPYLEVDKLHVQASAVPVVGCSLFLQEFLLKLNDTTIVACSMDSKYRARFGVG